MEYFTYWGILLYLISFLMEISVFFFLKYYHTRLDLIQKETPFSIVRLGLGYESNLTYDYLVHNIISTKFYSADYNFKGSGIYSKSNDEKILILFAKYTANAVINSDLLASYYFNDKIGMIQDFFTMNHKIPRSFSRTLEPFYHGLPLCNFIKSDLKKSAIYIGGGLQLLFGVIGRRWEGIDMWKKMIIDNDIKFIRPSEDEHVKDMRFLEDQCYW
jgi:hypothetical protein